MIATESFCEFQSADRKKLLDCIIEIGVIKFACNNLELSMEDPYLITYEIYSTVNCAVVTDVYTVADLGFLKGGFWSL